MCHKAVYTYPSIIQFVPECCMIQDMCDKVFNRCYFVFTLFLIVRAVSKDLFLNVYCPNKYKTQKMCDEVVDDSLAILRNLFPIGLLQINDLKTFYCFVC